MQTHALSSREFKVESTPFAVARVGDVVLAGLCSAWGSWSGLDAAAASAC